MTGDGWEPTGRYVTRRQCPHCDLHLDEPPMETSTQWLAGTVVFRARQVSALPALAAHILADHPDSTTAQQIRTVVAEHGSVERAVQDDLARLTRSVTRRLGGQ